MCMYSHVAIALNQPLKNVQMSCNMICTPVAVTVLYYTCEMCAAIYIAIHKLKNDLII